MNAVFTEIAWEDYTYCQNTDNKLAKKINEVIKDIKRTPFEGIGTSEGIMRRKVLS